MTEQSENKVTKTDTIDKSTQPAALTVAKGELSEQELDKIAGGNIGSQSSGAGAGKVTFNPF